MDVVGHQAVRPDLHAMTAAPLGHEPELCPVIVIAKERLLAAIAPLRDMMRITRNDDTCESRHGRTLQPPAAHGKKSVWCPPISAGFASLHPAYEKVLAGSYRRQSNGFSFHLRSCACTLRLGSGL